MQIVQQLLEHHDDDIDDVVEMVRTDERFLLLIWNYYNLEAWMFQLELDEDDEITSVEVVVLIEPQTEQVEQLDDMNLWNLFRI